MFFIHKITKKFSDFLSKIVNELPHFFHQAHERLLHYLLKWNLLDNIGTQTRITFWLCFCINALVDQLCFFNLQLQFCITFIHSSQLLFYDCGYPRWSVVFTLPNSIFFYYLFYDFYYNAYGTPEERKKAKALADRNGHIKDNSKHETEDKHEMIHTNGKVGNGFAKKHD